MWIQDLWVYDCRRTEMCVIPYGIQEVKSRSAPTTRAWVGDKLLKTYIITATTSEWFKTKGRHAIYAAGCNVELSTTKHGMDIVDVDALKAQEKANGNGGNGLNGKISHSNGIQGNGVTGTGFTPS